MAKFNAGGIAQLRQEDITGGLQNSLLALSDRHTARQDRASQALDAYSPIAKQQDISSVINSIDGVGGVQRGQETQEGVSAKYELLNKDYEQRMDVLRSKGYEANKQVTHYDNNGVPITNPGLDGINKEAEQLTQGHAIAINYLNKRLVTGVAANKGILDRVSNPKDYEQRLVNHLMDRGIDMDTARKQAKLKAAPYYPKDLTEREKERIKLLSDQNKELYKPTVENTNSTGNKPGTIAGTINAVNKATKGTTKDKKYNKYNNGSLAAIADDMYDSGDQQEGLFGTNFLKNVGFGDTKDSFAGKLRNASNRYPDIPNSIWAEALDKGIKGENGALLTKDKHIDQEELIKEGIELYRNKKSNGTLLSGSGNNAEMLKSLLNGNYKETKTKGITPAAAKQIAANNRALALLTTGKTNKTAEQNVKEIFGNDTVKPTAKSTTKEPVVKKPKKTVKPVVTSKKKTAKPKSAILTTTTTDKQKLLDKASRPDLTTTSTREEEQLVRDLQGFDETKDIKGNVADLNIPTDTPYSPNNKKKVKEELSTSGYDVKGKTDAELRQKYESVLGIQKDKEYKTKSASRKKYIDSLVPEPKTPWAAPSIDLSRVNGKITPTSAKAIVNKKFGDTSGMSDEEIAIKLVNYQKKNKGMIPSDLQDAADYYSKKANSFSNRGKRAIGQGKVLALDAASLPVNAAAWISGKVGKDSVTDTDKTVLEKFAKTVNTITDEQKDRQSKDLGMSREDYDTAAVVVELFGVTGPGSKIREAAVGVKNSAKLIKSTYKKLKAQGKRKKALEDGIIEMLKKSPSKSNKMRGPSRSPKTAAQRTKELKEQSASKAKESGFSYSDISM